MTLRHDFSAWRRNASVMPSRADVISEVLRELQVEIDRAPDLVERKRLEAEATVLRVAFAHAAEDQEHPSDVLDPALASSRREALTR